jgi:hypothetical protein
MTPELTVVYVLGSLSLAIGVAVLVYRRRLAALNAKAIKNTFPAQLGRAPAASSTPRIFAMIGVVAIVLGLFVIVLGIMVSVGVLELH